MKTMAYAKAKEWLLGIGIATFILFLVWVFCKVNAMAMQAIEEITQAMGG